MRLGAPLMSLVIIALAVGVVAAPGRAQEPAVACDADRDCTRTTAQAQDCAEQRFDLAPGGAGQMAEQQFTATLPDADGLRHQFARVDRDGDGRISRDEWMAWFGPAYAGERAVISGTD